MSATTAPDTRVGTGPWGWLVYVGGTLAERFIAGVIFADGEGPGKRLAVRPEEGNAMTVARGVDADADTVQRANRGHNRSPQRRVVRPGGRRWMTSVAREPVSLLRKMFGQAILVISGPGRRMYQNLAPKPEGTIFSKRSTPQGTDRTPHDATTIMAGG